MKKTAHVVLTLSDILAKKNVAELKELAKGNQIKGYSKLTKTALIEVVSRAMEQPETLGALLYILNEHAMDIFCRAAKTNSPVPVEEEGLYQCKILSNLCYLQISKEDDGIYCVMPEEIKTTFSQMVECGFVKHKQQGDLLNRYAQAVTNLYGVYDVDAFVALVNSQNEVKIDADEVFSALLPHVAAEDGYCFWKEYLINSGFEENEFKDVPDLLQRIENKSRYRPEKAELLRYANWDYFERNIHTARLQGFIIEQLGQPYDMAQVLLAEIRYACAVDANMQQIFSLFTDHQVTLKEENTEQLTQLIINVANNTRRWSNNGYTPNELHKGVSDALTPRTVHTKKIGRNDPCPCGSGKKYKKCCGR